MKKIFIFFILQIIGTLGALASVNVQSSVSPQAVSPDDLLTLTVRIEYQGRARVQSPELPHLEDFFVVNQSVSESYQFGSLGSKNQKEYQYSLKPKKEGTFQIGSVKVMVDGDEYQTAPLEVKVSSQIPSRPSLPAQRGRTWGSFLDPFFGGGASPFFSAGEDIKEEDILFKLVMDRKKPYVGEMIVAQWFFYLRNEHAGRVFNSMVDQPPNLSGFWMETLEHPVSLIFINAAQEEISGVSYLKDLLTSMAIFPLRAGQLNIGSLKASLSTRSLLAAQSMFQKETDKHTMTVLPLPEKGGNNFFTEAVGDFHVSADVSKRTRSVKDPIIYKVTFEGRGHPRLIRLPDLPFGSAWEVYDVTESQTFNFSKSTKEFEVILIPKQSGDLKIPSFELSTFDAQLGIYKTHILPEFSLKIDEDTLKKEEVTNSNESTGDGDGELEQTERQDIKSATEEEDISLDIWISEDTGTQGVMAYRRQVWMLAYGFLLTVLLWIIFRAAWSYKRSNFLEQLIKERLQLVDQKIKHQLSRDAGSHLTQLIYLFLFELSDHHLRPLSQNLESLLKSIPPSIKVRYESQIKEVMFELEQISFAPAETAARLRTQSHLRSVRDKVSSLLKDMGKYYSRRSLEK